MPAWSARQPPCVSRLAPARLQPAHALARQLWPMVWPALQLVSPTASASLAYAQACDGFAIARRVAILAPKEAARQLRAAYTPRLAVGLSCLCAHALALQTPAPARPAPSTAAATPARARATSAPVATLAPTVTCHQVIHDGCCHMFPACCPTAGADVCGCPPAQWCRWH